MPQAITQSEYETMMAEESAPASPNDEISLDMRQERVANVLDQLDPIALLLDVERKIRGLKYNRKTGNWIAIDPNKRPVSDLLVSNIITILSTFLNKNTTMSNFSTDQINALMENLVEQIADDLTVNDEKYGLTGDYPEMTRIGNIICGTTFIVLLRAQNGMESRRIFSSLSLKGDVGSGQEQKKGVWDALKFWN